MHDLISVIIPVYNGEDYLLEAIESVFQQTHVNKEIIVVNDGSRDGSERIARSFPDVRYLHQSNQGNAKARNLGIELAQGEFVAFLDQDDRFAPKKLEKQLFLLLEKDRMFSLCHGRFFLQEGQSWPTWLDPRFRDESHLSYVPGSILARKSLFGVIGGFDESYEMGSDSDWFFRAKDAGVEPAIVEETLLYKRAHGNNQSGNVKRAHQELLKLVRESVERKRRNA